VTFVANPQEGGIVHRRRPFLRSSALAPTGAKTEKPAQNVSIGRKTRSKVERSLSKVEVPLEKLNDAAFKVEVSLAKLKDALPKVEVLLPKVKYAASKVEMASQKIKYRRPTTFYDVLQTFDGVSSDAGGGSRGLGEVWSLSGEPSGAFGGAGSAFWEAPKGLGDGSAVLRALRFRLAGGSTAFF
jgi:hypothetical protein